MLDVITDWLHNIVAAILVILPDSPFSDFIDELDTSGWVKALNWIIPVGDFIAIGTVWLVAIGVFYAYQIILRWAKAVGD